MRLSDVDVAERPLPVTVPEVDVLLGVDLLDADVLSGVVGPLLPGPGTSRVAEALSFAVVAVGRPSGDALERPAAGGLAGGWADGLAGGCAAGVVVWAGRSGRTRGAGTREEVALRANDQPSKPPGRAERLRTPYGL